MSLEIQLIRPEQVRNVQGGSGIQGRPGVLYQFEDSTELYWWDGERHQMLGGRELPESPESSGTITRDSGGKMIVMSAAITIPANVFRKGRALAFWNKTGASSAINAGAGMTVRLANSASTGNRTLADNALGGVWFFSATECIVWGAGVT